MQWLWLILFCVIIVGFYLTEGRTTVREWRLRLGGKMVTGKVVERWNGAGRYGPTFHATVRFRPDRRNDVHTVSGHVDPDVAVGDSFPVRYLPSNPDVAVMSEGKAMLVFKTAVVLFLTFILLNMVLGALLLETP